MKQIFLSLIFVPFSFAIGVPDAGSLLTEESNILERQSLPKIIPKPIISSGEVAIEDKDDGEKIFVKNFVFEGTKAAFTVDELNELIEADLNQELSFGEIQNLVNRIRNAYVEKGYFLTSVSIPEQEVVNGSLVVNINEGSLDPDAPYKVKGINLRLKENLPIKYLSKAMNGKVTHSGLERGILNINDIPGISGTINLSPGSVPGSTQVELDVMEAPLVEGMISADNFGSRYTGEYRGTAMVNVNNPSKLGDQVTLTKVLSFDGNFDMNLIGYNFPLGRSGLRSNFYYSKLDYQLGKELETDPVSKGTADVYSGGFNYPVFNSSRRSVFLSGTYNFKDLYNENLGVVVSDKTAETQDVGLIFQNTDNIVNSGFTQLSLTQTFGDTDLTKVAADFAADQGAGGAKTNGNFQKFNAQVFRIQEITDKLNLQILASAQKVDKNVDSSEDFSLGGPTAIRAYPSGEAAGDEGFRVSVDAQYNLISGSKFGAIILSSFYDYGEIKQYKDTYDIVMTSPNEYSLEGWGVALDFLTMNRFNLKIIWADAIGDNPGKTLGNNSDGKNNRSRIWAMARFSF
jgi:hemolysin activation/secretion protein